MEITPIYQGQKQGGGLRKTPYVDFKIYSLKILIPLRTHKNT